MTTRIDLVLRDLMAQRKISVRELAEASEVPASTISEWLNQRIPKNPTQVRKVARVLGVTLHYLLFGEADTNERRPSTTLQGEIVSGIYEISIKRLGEKIPEELK